MIVSTITAKRVFGQDPLGFIPLVPNNNGQFDYIASQAVERTYEYSTVTFDADVRITKDNLLAQIKADLDANYTPTIFTDPAKTYDVEYNVVSIELNYEALSGSIYHERTYYFYVDVLLKVNIS